MKSLTLLISLISFSLQAATLGEEAPAFTLQNQEGKSVSLLDFKGKVVVLEWLNHGCPFVRKHYDTGNMQALQQAATKNDVVWLSVISSASGKQGHVDSAGAKSDMGKYDSKATHVLLDPTGKTGQAYGAKTTPHMYVINEKQELIYQGAIDDKSSADKETVKGAKNYVAAALKDHWGKKTVTLASTKTYGCGVKY